jgi:hypothetical protein
VATFLFLTSKWVPVRSSGRRRSGGVSVTQPVTVQSLESAERLVLVGVAGFEPATPSSRTRCATRGGNQSWMNLQARYEVLVAERHNFRQLFGGLAPAPPGEVGNGGADHDASPGYYAADQYRENFRAARLGARLRREEGIQLQLQLQGASSFRAELTAFWGSP